MKNLTQLFSSRARHATVAAVVLSSLGSGPLRADTNLSGAATTTGSPATSAAVGHDTASLAKQSQNPVADLISLPFQNNTNFNVGPGGDTANVLNIQPVIPVNLNEDWNLINRFIAPLIWPAEITPGTGDDFGIGDLQYSAFLSPSKPSAIIWGVGPVIQAPTATNGLGNNTWSAGPSFVLLAQPGNWVVGVLGQNVWSLDNSASKQEVNSFLTQYFINYNMAGGWYLTSAPVITANWEADQQWTVPFGGGIGRVFRIGSQPVNVSLQAYSNVVTPDFGPDWSVRFQFTLLFPKGKKAASPPPSNPGQWK